MNGDTMGRETLLISAPAPAVSHQFMAEVHREVATQSSKVLVIMLKNKNSKEAVEDSILVYKMINRD